MSEPNLAGGCREAPQRRQWTRFLWYPLAVTAVAELGRVHALGGRVVGWGGSRRGELTAPAALPVLAFIRWRHHSAPLSVGDQRGRHYGSPTASCMAAGGGLLDIWDRASAIGREG